jgi:soluble lytic murein transglycosylase-like protein
LRSAKRRTVALFVTVPLAFGAIGMEAMNQSLPVFAQKAIEMGSGSRLPIFTTPKIREAFLNPEKVAMKMTLDVAKEEYFKTEVPYGSIIYREAIKNELPPELIAAVVESESDFRVRLVSNKDARGLMQIVPETARFMRCEDPFDPDANIAAGTGYLHYLINRFGDVQVALAAYNAGEGTVERLGGIPRYPETIEYVERVSRRARFYRQGVQKRYTAAVQMASVIER